ncbi:MAG: hypothetical protein HXS47_12130 [Theionarchaea archaeon]|nr:hypothetical protein [Theionarchaea archaeon]
MNVSMLYTVSYIIAIAAAIILSMYFFREYSIKRLPASLAWGIGFILYALAQTSHLIAELFGEVTLGKSGYFGGLLIYAIAMTLFYYGTSLLFFNPGSFFREKAAILIFAVLGSFSGYITYSFPLEGFTQTAGTYIQSVMWIIFLIITFLFYRVTRRLPKNDPRKKVLSLVSVGWAMVTMYTLYLGLLIGRWVIIDALFLIIHAVAWIMILYGMVLGKAAKS